MNSDNQTKAVDRGKVCDPRTSGKTIYVSKPQAARWLDQLAKMIDFGGNNTGCLEELRDNLEDCGWLACWKREDVVVELCPSTLAGVLAEVLKSSGTDRPKEDLETLEEIARVLSRVG